MTIQIFGFDRPNFMRTVRIVTSEKNVAYQVVPEAPRSPAAKAINPFGLIPCLRDGDLEITESHAIARYLDAVGDGPALVPSDSTGAAVANHWVSMVAASVDKFLLRMYVVPHKYHKDDDGNTIRTDIDQAIKRFPLVFGTLNEAAKAGNLASADIPWRTAS